MLNGRSPQDPEGEFTFTSATGCSLVDYVMVSPELHHMINDFRVDDEDSSDHFPLLFSIPCLKLQNADLPTEQTERRTKFTWRPDKAPQFTQRMVDAVCAQLLDTFYAHVAENRIDEAVDSLVNMYAYAAEDMKCVPSGVNKNSKSNFQGWDQDCEDAKRDKCNLLNIFRRTRSEADLKSYLLAKKSFKCVCAKKKEQFQLQTQAKLKSEMVDAKTCWNIIRSFKRSKPENSISSEEWSAYFKNLLNQPNNLDANFEASVNESLLNHDHGNCVPCTNNDPIELNSDIDAEEVLFAIKSLPSKKAPGLDGLCIELFKHSSSVAVPMLTVLFNKILSSGKFPAFRSHALLIPLYKKGPMTFMAAFSESYVLCTHN